MTTTRTARVSRQILQDLSEIIERELKDPRVGMITLTAVHMTPDLHTARVFFSRLGSAEEREESRRALEHAVGFLRRELGRRLRLRHVPELRFLVDDSLDVSDRISRILDRDKETSHDADDER